MTFVLIKIKVVGQCYYENKKKKEEEKKEEKTAKRGQEEEEKSSEETPKFIGERKILLITKNPHASAQNFCCDRWSPSVLFSNSIGFKKREKRRETEKKRNRERIHTTNSTR